MKKFLEFICWELVVPLVSNVFMFLMGMVMFGWALSFFGLMVFFVPSPIWVRWVVGIFDSFCAIMIIYGWIYDAWKGGYKQN